MKLSVCLHSPETNFDCSSEGLAYIAGYLAFKFKHQYPELGVKTCEAPVFPEDNSRWITALSRGGLMKPSNNFLQTVHLFEMEFVKFHGGKVNQASNVVKRFSNILETKFPNVPADVVKKFSRLRTFVRLKELNKEVREQQLTRRNSKQLRQFQF